MDLTTTSMQSVYEFHRVFGHPINEPLSEDIRLTRANLVFEEAKELKEALDENNHLEIVDALADCVYVVAGTAIAAKGKDLALAADDIHAIVSLSVADLIGNTMRQDLEAIATDLIRYANRIADLEVDSLEVAELGLISIHRIEMLCSAMQIDMLGAFNEVHRSNMTKLWTEDTDQRKEQIASDPKRYADIAFRTRDDGGNGLVGYRLLDGKILKPPTYSPAKLTPFFNECLISSIC